jgi:hypothetical protein
MSKYKLDFQVGVTINSNYKSLETSQVRRAIENVIEQAINDALDGVQMDAVDVLTNNGLDDNDIQDFYNDDPDENEYITRIDVVVQEN